jgi:hypothetical protein
MFLMLITYVCDGEWYGKMVVATFSGRLVQSDLKLVVRNRHYIWRPTVPYHPCSRHTL